MGNKLFYLLGITLVLVQNAFARPQSLEEIFNQLFRTSTQVPSVTNFRPLVQRPRTPSTTTTAQPPQFTRCIETCPKTAQYNPVCGSDRQTYNNISVLRCAQRCGLDITQIRLGVCAPRGK